jgi:hypothetical protein
VLRLAAGAKLVSGQFDPTQHKAVMAQHRQLCRGGAFDSALGAARPSRFCGEMSRRQFEWLKEIGQVIPTPGCNPM